MHMQTQKCYYAERYDQEYFERLYTENADPWSVLASAYEYDKYAATTSALEQSHYGSVLELGCSIGGLTRRLATRCDRLVAVDTSEAALARARQICGYSNVEFVQAHLPDGDFAGPFDLIVLSEILYYFSMPALVRLADRVARVARPGGEYVVVHWTGETDFPLTGDRATELFQTLVRAKLRARTRHPSYRLESWRAPARATDPA